MATSYLLALALSLPLAGWLGRRFGVGRVWLASLAAFTITSGLCAITGNIGLLITFRVLQGLAGGLLIPAGQTVLGRAVGPERLGRVMATLGIAVSVAPAIGPVVGGVILSGLSWPWLFAINLPIGVLGLALGLRYVPRGEPESAGRLDRFGLILISVGLPLVVFAATQWGDNGRLSPLVIATFVAGAAALAGFGVHARRHADPLLDLSLYRDPLYRAASLASAFNGALVFGSGIVVTLHFQLGRGDDLITTGLHLLGFVGATAVAAPITGRLIDRHGPAPVALAGSLLAVASTAPFTVLPVDANGLLVQLLLIVFGASVALLAMPAGIAAYKSVDPRRLPDATTQINILQRVGGSLGGAVFAVLIAARLPDTEAAFRTGYVATCIGAVGALGAAWLVHRASPHPAGTPHREQR